MKRLRILGLALLALFALGAVAASMASAKEGVLEVGATFTIAGTPGVVATLVNLNGEEIKCKETSGSGTFTSNTAATGTFTFKGCTALGFAANTLGDASGTIKSNVGFTVCLTNSATLLFGVLIEPKETVHVEVPAVKGLLLVKGAVIGSLSKAGELKGKEFAVAFAEKDETTRLTCKVEETTLKSTFEAALDTKADVDAFETASGTVTFNKEVVFMDK